MAPVNQILPKEINQMVTCFGCDGSFDVCDRYCRWCNWTFIPDNYGPPEQRGADSSIPHCDSRIGNPEYRGIGLVLAQGVFRDDEEELGTVMNLIETRSISHNANRGYFPDRTASVVSQ